MAIKNIRIRPEGGNDFRDVLHPETNAGMVLTENGKTMQEEFNEHKEKVATDTERGHVSLQDIPLPDKASKAEAEAGVNDEKMMTPLRTKEAINELQAVKSVNGKTGIVNITKGDLNLGSVDNLKQMPMSGGTFTGQVIAQDNTSYTTAQIRNCILSTADASGTAPKGTIWIKYK